MKWHTLKIGERYIVKPPYKKEVVATLVEAAKYYRWLVLTDDGVTLTVRSQAIRREAPKGEA